MKNSTLRFYFDGFKMQEVPEIDGEEMYQELPTNEIVEKYDINKFFRNLTYTTVTQVIGVVLALKYVVPILAPLMVFKAVTPLAKPLFFIKTTLI